MRFGVREIANVTLRAKATQYLGSKKFYKNEPILYFDTLKTSSLEGASTTVYATGGRGNTRLVAWEGERTLTFTMEDALISPESFSILSGAGLIAATQDNPIYVHMTSQVEVKEANFITLPEAPCWNKQYTSDDDLYNTGADIFVMTMTNGQIDSEPCVPVKIDLEKDPSGKTIQCFGHAGTIDKYDIVLVDYYVKRTGGAQVIEITADKFGGNYYLEAQTLFRDEQSGVDMPAEFIIPNCKVQSNFNFTMAASGDPSTFTFTMDAFPDYTKFDLTHKVLAAIQVITEAVDDADDQREACKKFEASAPFAKDKDGKNLVTLTFDNSSTETYTKMTAEGSNVPGDSFDKDVFGQTLPGKAVEIDLEMRVKADETYTVKQTNPSLSVLYPTGDEYIKGNTKTKDYLGAQLAGGYGLLLGETRGVVEVEVTDKTGKIVQTVRITNRINFAKDATGSEIESVE